MCSDLTFLLACRQLFGLTFYQLESSLHLSFDGQAAVSSDLTFILMTGSCLLLTLLVCKVVCSVLIFILSDQTAVCSDLTFVLSRKHLFVLTSPLF